MSYDLDIDKIQANLVLKSRITRVTMRLIKCLLLIVFTLAVLVIALGMYTLGWWENLPLLNRLSGQQRFEEYVCAPIPEEISQVQGGYSGFPQGVVATYFKYSGSFPSGDCLRNWTKVEPAALEQTYLSQFWENRVDLVFGKEPREKERAEQFLWEKYIILDESRKEGLLFIP